MYQEVLRETRRKLASRNEFQKKKIKAQHRQRRAEINQEAKGAIVHSQRPLSYRKEKRRILASDRRISIHKVEEQEGQKTINWADNGKERLQKYLI